MFALPVDDLGEHVGQGKEEEQRVTRLQDLERRGILETEEEAGSPGSAQRASASAMVYDAVTAIAVTAATDMVALVPRRYAEACANSTQIRIIDFPPSPNPVHRPVSRRNGALLGSSPWLRYFGVIARHICPQ